MGSPTANGGQLKMDDVIVLKVADFSIYPIGRDDADSDVNGEKFRNEFLIPALNEAQKLSKKVYVSLDGVLSFGSSFLEEAFGGLVRSKRFTKLFIESTLVIECHNSVQKRYKDRILAYIRNAK